MSYWVELHCDALMNGCYSNKNDNPGIKVNLLKVAKRELTKQAREQGWTCKDGKWFCPYCNRQWLLESKR